MNSRAGKLAVILCMVLCVSVGLFAQVGKHPPGPLGLDRMLVGTVEKAPKVKSATHAKGAKRAAQYVMSAEGETFQLYGHEAELKKLCGKKVRLTGTAVGNNVTVNSVEASE